ncbi:hypothetical protein K431DRAFT_283958 [Polychaeton citri CBS 116435]|uniref:RAVE complex protein Rav1 C-terminal domain-containing protein n=1 Tax=Polychaeton citri CBS 116435 TaxID=1314669 RepID=A0A9P4UQ77_9PEZI|nr:hypothetical protein K431DRAFT_283958 [Polychaeton citri CBS 116435]
MPSTSPGRGQNAVPNAASNFDQLLPGAPIDGLQSFNSFKFRQKRFIAYVSGRSLSIFSAPKVLVHVIWFDDEAIGLAAEPSTSRIAVATRNEIYVLEPIAEGWTKVRWETALTLKKENNNEAGTLSWGNPGELLVGDAKSLTLYSTLPSSRSSSPSSSPIEPIQIETRLPLWVKSLPNPVKFSTFSPSGSLIASCGVSDRFVKIWRRLSFEEGLFDYAYLPHPAPVTHISWRSPNDNADIVRASGIGRRHEEEPEILYTIAADGILRVWRAGGLTDLDILVLQTSINLIDAIPPLPNDITTESDRKSDRYTLIIPAHEFSQAVAAAVAAAVGLVHRTNISHALELLKEIASKEPDVFIIMDGQGRMSAWGLQSVGHKRRPETPSSREPFHIAHVEDSSLLIPRGKNATFSTWFEGDQLNIIAHRFGHSRRAGGISWWTSSVELFFSHATSTTERLSQACDWTGHHAEVTGLGFANEMLLSTAQGEGTIQWRPHGKGFDLASIKKSVDLLVRRESRLLHGHLPKELFTSANSPDHIRRYADITTVTSSKEVKIFNTRERYIEFNEAFDKPILSIALPTPPQAIAIAFSSHVDVYVRNLYGDASAWHRIKQVSLADMNLSIKALSWTSNNELVLGAGNGIFVTGDCFSSHNLPPEVKQSLDISEDDNTDFSLHTIARSMLSQLPIWHPKVISHFVYWGDVQVVLRLLERLHYKLKFYGEGDHLDYLLDLDEQQLLEGTSISTHSISQEIFDKIVDQLSENKLPRLTRSDQQELKSVLVAFAFLLKHREGLDGNAQRYLFMWKLKSHRMEFGRPNADELTNGSVHSRNQAPKMSWREIAFAYHSKTQQPLFDLLILHYDNKLSWQTSGSLGIVRWLYETEARAQAFELIAQSEYRSLQPPDPVNATLFYLALRKKQTLLALWRIATWHKEQRTTMNFLKRDFTLPEARTAAKKNAYALMGKRRFRYAAAFFLLADDPASATSVLAGQCEDVPLAVAVARVYCGDGTPVLCDLLESRLLPRARQKSDRWLLSWAQSLVHDKEAAAIELVQPFDDDGIKDWQQDDPATLILYKQLRNGEKKEELMYVLKALRILQKMGLVIPAMQLAARYSFGKPPAVSSATVMQPSKIEANGASQNDVSSLLDDFSTSNKTNTFDTSDGPTATDAPQQSVDGSKADRETQAAELLKKLRAKKNDSGDATQAAGTKSIPEKEKRAPTQFKEPDTGSLLDSFGF